MSEDGQDVADMRLHPLGKGLFYLEVCTFVYRPGSYREGVIDDPLKELLIETHPVGVVTEVPS